MATININNKRYEIPERLTIDQYHGVLQFDWNDPKYYPYIVSQLTGAPLDLLVKADEEAMVLAISMIVKSMNDRKEVEMLELDQIMFGQFIDADVYLALGLEKHFKELATLLAPKAIWADEAMWAVDRFAAFRTYTYRQYKVLFGLTDKDLDEEVEDTPEVKLDIARAWYKVIVGLAQDDLLKIDQVTDEPLIKALNFMALQKEKVMAENEQKLKQRRQYDLSRSRT